MRPGWEDVPLLAGNPADFENHIPAHYIIQYELLGGKANLIGLRVHRSKKGIKWKSAMAALALSTLPSSTQMTFP